MLQSAHPLFLLVIATALEVSGDGLVRLALQHPAGPVRLAMFGVSAALLFGYGLCLNLAPLDFGRVVGLYIATLFVMWQVISFVFFRTMPTLPILVGGVLIIGGGAIVSFWKPV